jgi:hypothetical protein
MPRGRKSKVGETRVSRNGYHYTRTESGWELTHRLVIEQRLGRDLRDDERVRFLDGDRSNIDPSNLECYTVGEKTKERKRAQIESRIEDLKAQLEELA